MRSSSASSFAPGEYLFHVGCVSHKYCSLSIPFDWCVMGSWEDDAIEPQYRILRLGDTAGVDSTPPCAINSGG